MSEKSFPVSVIVNTKNRKEDLEKCLKAIINGSYSNFEIIVIDNDSQDGTEDLLKRYNVRRINSNSKKLSQLFNIG
ncbi:MAG: glycosyltransferase family 2 protein, partial [Candidatus Omnitrophota bacterium]